MVKNSLITKIKNIFWGSTTNPITNYEDSNNFNLAIEKIFINILMNTRSNGYFVTQKIPIDTLFKRNYKNVYDLDIVLSLIEKKLMECGVSMSIAVNELNNEKLIFIRSGYNEEN